MPAQHKAKLFNKVAKESLRHWGNPGFGWREDRFPKARVGVAEGDSWFDYRPAWIEAPFKGDLLSRLMKTKRYNIHRVSEAGDTLENMVYGTGFDKNWQRKPPQLADTVKLVKKLGPEFFLFSGGGNDFAGPELEGLLNHQNSGRGAIRSEFTNYIFGSYIPACYEAVIRAIHAVDRDIQIFLHGYGHADPSGEAVINAPGGWRFVGPWLRPALTKKGFTKQVDRRRIIRTLVDRLNLALAAVARDHPNVHYIDLRPELNYNDWANELHLNKRGWAKAAAAFDDAIAKVLPPK